MTRKVLEVAAYVPRDSTYGRALEAWEHAMDDAAAAEAALGAIRERVRVARTRSTDCARRGYDAIAAGQEAFARGLLDAAQAHEVMAWEGEAQIAEGERRCAALRARCDELDAEARQQGERHARESARVRLVRDCARCLAHAPQAPSSHAGGGGDVVGGEVAR
jgi:hypothetical protein